MEQPHQQNVLTKLIFAWTVRSLETAPQGNKQERVRSVLILVLVVIGEECATGSWENVFVDSIWEFVEILNNLIYNYNTWSHIKNIF